MHVVKTAVLALLLTTVAFCQTDQKPATSTEQKQTNTNENADTYRLDVTIRETQEGKLVSSRNYSALVRGFRGGPRTIRIGSRLPVGTSGTSQGVNYIDVGTNLTIRMWEMEGKVILSMTVEVSSIAPPDATSGVKLAEYPILRQFRTDQEAAIPLGKPTLLNSVDDPNSNHRFQVEVTATKEKAE
jgi:hypothetical protein